MAVYPRWRGEHVGASEDVAKNIGLSPLARGTHWQQSLTLLNARFIPAGAGNTEALTVQLIVLSVYPRWRGEHVSA